MVGGTGFLSKKDQNDDDACLGSLIGQHPPTESSCVMKVTVSTTPAESEEAFWAEANPAKELAERK